MIVAAKDQLEPGTVMTSQCVRIESRIQLNFQRVKAFYPPPVPARATSSQTLVFSLIYVRMRLRANPASRHVSSAENDAMGRLLLAAELWFRALGLRPFPLQAAFDRHEAGERPIRPKSGGDLSSPSV